MIDLWGGDEKKAQASYEKLEAAGNFRRCDRCGGRSA